MTTSGYACLAFVVPNMPTRGQQSVTDVSVLVVLSCSLRYLHAQEKNAEKQLFGTKDKMARITTISRFSARHGGAIVINDFVFITFARGR